MTAALKRVATEPAEFGAASAAADAAQIMESVIAKGDLAALDPGERAAYYVAVCRSMGLNPLTRPFQYIDFGTGGGGLQLYPRAALADQLRGLHKIETRILDRRVEQGIYTVLVEARHPDGRVETDMGAVPVQGLAGAFLANAMKKGVTQGKRRATLAMLGMSLIDDDELKAIRGARVVRVDAETGELLDRAPGLPMETPERPWATGIAEPAQAPEVEPPIRNGGGFAHLDEAREERGLAPEQLDFVVGFLFPGLGGGVGKLTEAMAADLAWRLTEARDDEVETWRRDWAAEFAAAPDRTALQALWREAAAAGGAKATHPAIARAYGLRYRALGSAEVNPAEQERLGIAPTDADRAAVAERWRQ